MNNKGITLIELLAVLIVLAIVLLLVVPKINSIIENSRIKTMQTSALTIAKIAENYYQSNEAFEDGKAIDSVSCSDVAKLNEDYESCDINYNDEGIATVRLIGKNKFAGIICIGTKEDIACEQDESLLYTVTLDAQGGTIPTGFNWTGSGNTAAKTVVLGQTYGEFPIPTKENYTFMGWSTTGYLLPSEYQEVEYIESTGTQYIDTGYYMTSDNATIKTKVFVSNVPDSEQDIISNQDNSTGRFVIGFYTNKVFAYTRDNKNGDTNNYTSAYIGSNTFNIEANFDYTNHQKILKVNNETINQIQNAKISNSNQTIKLFKAANSNSYIFSGSLYYMKIYDYDTLVRNFIPCYRKSDNEIGLYDTVEGVFYTNQGSGTFLKGNDVNYITSSTNVSINSNHTLYAIWKYNPVVTFDYNDGGVTSNTTKRVVLGETYGELPTPTRDGYTFMGWNGKNKFDYENILETNSDTVSLAELNGIQTISWINNVNTSSQKFLQGYFKENTQFTFSGKIASSINNWLNIIISYTDGSYVYIASNSCIQNTFLNIVRTSSTNKTINYLKGAHANNEIMYIDINSFQIEEGSVATPYEPYYITSDTTVVQDKNHTLTAIWEANS